MIRRILKLLFMCCILLLTSISANAEGETKQAEWQRTDKLVTSGIYTYRITDELKKEIELRGINSAEANIIIPGEIDGYSVVSVGYSGIIYVPYDSEVDSACEITDENELKPLQISGCSDTVTQITIPDGVRTIGAAAFLDFRHLNKINLSDSITGIREMAFKGCESLQAPDIPANTKLGNRVFFGCGSMHKVTLSTANIADELFDGQNIKELHIVKSQYDKTGNVSFPINNTTFGGGIGNDIDKVIVDSGVKSVEVSNIGIKKLIIKGKNTKIKSYDLTKKNIKKTSIHAVKGSKAVKFARKWKIKHFVYKKIGSKEAVRYTYNKKKGWKSFKKKMK